MDDGRYKIEGRRPLETANLSKSVVIKRIGDFKGFYFLKLSYFGLIIA